MKTGQDLRGSVPLDTCLNYKDFLSGPGRVNCRTIEQMRLANALCRFTESAEAPASV